MRYQQKVMQENAQKKRDLYSYEDTQQKLLTSSLGAGKVRAMFEEQRRSRITAGIDKSYLLEPIPTDTTKNIKQQRQVVGPSKSSRDQKMLNYTKVIVPPLQNRLINNDINGNNHINGKETIGSLKAGDFKIANSSPKFITKTRTDKSAISSNLIGKPGAKVNNSAPSHVMKHVTDQKPSPSRSTKSGNSTASSSSNRSYDGPKVLAKGDKISSVKSSNQNSFDEADAPVPEGLTRCGICKRNFADDRIEKHQVICQKTKAKKRKTFDSSKKRVQGTEAEPYTRKPLTKITSKSVNTTAASQSKSSSWRAKHEDFIKTIRAAKEMQAYVAKGGKLSDLPPPEPSINPDYVQCPHCSRRFNEAAGSRHIPLCQNINKPKSKTSMANKTSGLNRRR